MAAIGPEGSSCGVIPRWTFGIAQSSPLAFEGPAWVLTGLVAFTVYKLVARLGLRRLAAREAEDDGNVRLLLLRVFALGVRSQRFLDALGRHWRHAGSVQLIAGPDLATATVEPHEFLDFLGGKLARRFIDGSEALRQRLAEMDLRRDGDGRFRINDFFCYDDTWRLVLARLIAESDVVPMDLRGFAPGNVGVVYEIEQLVDVVPLGRVQMVVDATTDLPFLEETLRAAWRRTRPDSPNRRSGSATLRLFRLADPEGRDLVALLRQLSDARAESRAVVPEAA